MTDPHPHAPAAHPPPDASATPAPPASDPRRRRWTLADDSPLTNAPRWAGWAVVGIGVVAGATLRGEALGAGVVVLLLALGVVVARVRRTTGLPSVDLRAAPLERVPWVRVWWALAAALTLVPVLRAAAWVVVPALVTAVAMASLALSGGARWGQLAAGLSAVWARLPLGPWLTARVVAHGVRLRPARAAARGIALAAGLLALFVPLLMSADAAFAQLLQEAAPNAWDAGPLFGRALILSLFVALGGALLAVRLRPPDPAAVAPRGVLGETESNIALGALTALFAAFVALQLATLFGGSDHVLRTTGLTYAEYARSGFAQLLVVAALTLAVLAAGRRWARPHRLLPVALCLLTLVVLVSALRRVGLYEEALGFTRLRLAAHAALLYLGVVFCLVLVTRSARTLVAVSAAAVLLFAASDPEDRIARHNLERFERTGQIDLAYLGTLGPDAAPALQGVVALCVGDDGPAGFNLARAAARRTSTARRTGASGRCDPPRPTR